MTPGRYDNTPRWHCAHCAPPDASLTPSPPELAGQTCTAIVGLNGSTCGRPATHLDDRQRPICSLRYFKDIGRHIGEIHPDLTPAAVAARDPSSAEPDPPPVARVAQDPPHGEPAWIAEPPDPDRPFTVGDARAFVQDAVSLVVNSVGSLVKEHCGDAASMAQDPGTAVHPVGLCDDGKCAPCRSQRRDEHLQARHLFADELDHAIEWRGRDKVGELLARDGSDALADVLEGWRDAGRPEPAKQIEVVR